MNILFVSLLDFDSFQDRNIYTDLLREFVKNGHNVIAISPFERRTSKSESVIEENFGKIIKVKIGNTQKVNVIEKGISTILLEWQILNRARRCLRDTKFDLILYTTPPITFEKVIVHFKKRDGAMTYLLLKDIFPQNAVDLGMLSKRGIKALLYKWFRHKECKLYKISDYVGCMSKANAEYLLQENGYLDAKKVEVCPNSLEPVYEEISSEERIEIWQRYGVPQEKRIVLYGGNIGKPQGIEFFLRVIEACNNERVHFLIVGNGTDYSKVEQFAKVDNGRKMTVLKALPREEYEKLTACCDVGVILLDARFTIPNFPSRMLSYMQASLPILAATDGCTDVGSVIMESGAGLWSEHGDVEGFLDNLEQVLSEDCYGRMSKASKLCLEENYTSSHSYDVIRCHFV